ncbi:MAG: four helix bundle suffix domain-containing protein [Verrucomicrobiota bacterium]
MSSPAAERVYGKHSGYRNLKAYQVAELVYDFTCRFCARYVPRSDRHHDQMVQAARSGYQNIAEGSEDSATSKKLEMNLTNVARSSLDEARKDYIKHLVRRGLRHWQEGEAVFTEARNLRPKSVEEAAAWINRPGAVEPDEERAANLGVILATQAHWLTERLLDRQARDFETGGGFSERLHRARTGRDRSSVQSVSSVKPGQKSKADKTEEYPCPTTFSKITTTPARG